MTKRNKPTLCHMLSLIEDTQLQVVVLGHLIIESLIVEIIKIDIKKEDKIDLFRLNFPQKVNLCLSYELLDEKIGTFLKKLNKVRNHYAHYLGYQMKFDEIYDLGKMAYSSGVDYTDDLNLDKEFAESCYDERTLLYAIYSNVAHYLSLIIDDRGGKYHFS